MNKILNIKILNTVTMVSLAGLTAFIMGYIHNHSAVPLSGQDRLLHILLFPLSIVIFHLFTIFGASPAKKRNAEVFDQWSSLWVIPFLLIGISWEYWESWEMISAIFFAGYIVFRLAGFICFRQFEGSTRPLNIVDFACFVAGLELLNLFCKTGPGDFSLFQGFIGTIIVTAI
ncbi:hypothetical protein K8T06_12165, partial [bacterium]|nr:hypothetical protein [bacterium]